MVRKGFLSCHPRRIAKLLTSALVSSLSFGRPHLHPKSNPIARTLFLFVVLVVQGLSNSPGRRVLRIRGPAFRISRFTRFPSCHCSPLLLTVVFRSVPYGHLLEGLFRCPREFFRTCWPVEVCVFSGGRPAAAISQTQVSRFYPVSIVPLSTSGVGCCSQLTAPPLRELLKAFGAPERPGDNVSRFHDVRNHVTHSRCVLPCLESCPLLCIIVFCHV